MIDWDEDGDIDAEDVGLSAMMIDDLSSEEKSLKKQKRGCLGSCLGAVLLVLFFLGVLSYIFS